MTEKRCYICKETKPLLAFGKKATNPDGLQRLCKECQKIERKAYYDTHKEKEIENHRHYEATHRKEINAQRAVKRAHDPTFYQRTNAYVKRRAQESIEYLIGLRSRKRIERAIHVSGAQSHFIILSLLGCSLTQYREYLESTFKDGMTWDLYRKGEMQIDHKIQCCRFDLSRKDHQRACFHFSNTRMLFTSENAGRQQNIHLSEDELESFVRSISA